MPRPEGYLQRCRHVLFGLRRKLGKKPVFILNKRRKGERAPYLVIELDRPIVNRPAMGNKSAGHLRVAIPNLQEGSRGEPIGAPPLQACSCAANPISHQIVFVRIEVVVEVIPIGELPIATGGGGRIRIQDRKST